MAFTNRPQPLTLEDVAAVANVSPEIARARILQARGLPNPAEQEVAATIARADATQRQASDADYAERVRIAEHNRMVRKANDRAYKQAQADALGSRYA
jgi:hypothetical protein